MPSDLDFSEWDYAFPSRIVGAATIDRLLYGAYRVSVHGESYRWQKPVPKTKNLIV